MQYKVDTTINGTLNTRVLFKTRTKAQKHILSKFNAYAKDERFYIRFTHYSCWGKYRKPYNDMCIDLMHVETKSLNICIELLPV